jgi:hypothetical protein
MSAKNLLVVLIVLVVAVGSFWMGTSHPRKESGGKVRVMVKNEIENVVLMDENVEFYAGDTVFDILCRVASVEYNSYPGLGKFVTSIDNLKQTQTAWWLYYVNGILASISSDRYRVMDGDNILWKYTSEMPF